MQSISEIVQALSRQRGRTDNSPLALLRTLDGRAGERISHLPVGADLEQAWLAMTSEPFHPHQSQALTALRRNEPVALRAASPQINNTLALLAYALTSAEPGGAALALTHSLSAARSLHARFTSINERMPSGLRLSLTLVGEKQTNPYARLVICSVDALHGRVLRHHDRAWDLMWARLRTLLLPDIQRYTGIAGAHLADILLRTRRTALAHGAPPAIATVATLGMVANPETALTAALGMPWRIVNGDDDQLSETTLAIWRAGAGRLRDAADLALALQRNGYFVHITCDPLERAVMAPMIGDIPAITLGPDVADTQALIVVGYPGAGNIRRLLNGGYQAILLILGDQPHEHMIARNPETLLTIPPPEWPPAPANAYVTAQHILCAANELPLTANEVEAWGATEIVERLAASQQLVDLPDAEVCWKPGTEANDPYEEFHLSAPSGAAISAYNEQNRLIARLDPTTFERWSFAGASLPPLAGGQRVITRDEERATVSLRMESAIRRTLPLRRCRVEIRETRQTRSLIGGATLSWGRVVVDEEIYAYREQAGNGAPGDIQITTPLKIRWIAPACWFELHSPVQVIGQQIGWSVATAMPLRSLASATDLTPAYDHEQRRLFLVDSHPGGSGMAVWLFRHAETMLPLAYDIALACRQDAFLEPISRADMDWLLPLLGKTPQRQPEPAQTSSTGGSRPAPSLATDSSGSQEQRTGGSRPTPSPIAPTPPTSTGGRPAPSPTPVPPEPDAPFIEIPPRQPRSGSQDQRTGGAQDNRNSGSQDNRTGGTRPNPTNRPTPPPADSRQERFSIEPPAGEKPNSYGRSSGSQDQRGGSRAAPTPPEETPADPNALIARLRRQREQREGPPNQPTPQRQSNVSRGPVMARFKAGNHVFCLPYGEGTVQDSRMEDDRELLIIHFQDYGELEVDPAVSLVRLMNDEQEQRDELL